MQAAGQEPYTAGKLMETWPQLRDDWTLVDGRWMYTRVSTRDDAPEAPSVVFVPGLGVSSRYMVPTARRLAAHYSVYAPDLPGFGKSYRPAHALDIPRLADALDTWMEAVGLREATFMGNSMGCQVIVDLALRHPERVQRTVLAGPTFDRRSRRSLLSVLWRAARDAPHEPLPLWAIVARDYLSAGPLRLALTLRYALRDPFEQKLPLVEAPTLVVRGGMDAIVPVEWVRTVVRLLPSARLVILPGATHAVNFTAPGRLARLTSAFIRGDIALPR